MLLCSDLVGSVDGTVPLDLESNTGIDSTPMPMGMSSDPRYWRCDSCTLKNNSVSLVCEGCGGNRADPGRVVCDGDNLDEAESEAMRIQRAHDQQKFVVDFNFGVSVVPGYQTFAMKDLDEYVQASKREPVGCTESEMLILNLFSCNYPAVAAIRGWNASQHRCAISTFHRSYQGSYNNCGQIAVGVMSALERRDWSWNLKDNDFDKEMRSIAKSCNNDATNRAATTDGDLTQMIKRRLGGTYDINLKYGGVIVRSFLETVHLTTKWHHRLRDNGVLIQKPLAIIMNTDIDSRPNGGLGHWVVVLLRAPLVVSTPSPQVDPDGDPAAALPALPDGEPATALPDGEPAAALPALPDGEPAAALPALPDGKSECLERASAT